MKIFNILLASVFILLLSVLVTAMTQITLPAIFYSNEDATFINITGVWKPDSLSFSNVTDGNYSTCSGAFSNGTIQLNYTIPNSTNRALSSWQVKYNTSSGVNTVNLTIPSVCWNGTGEEGRGILALILNASDTTSARQCWNSSDYQTIGTNGDATGICEDTMYWYIPSRDLNWTATINHPRTPNAIFNSTTVTFNWTVIDYFLTASANYTFLNFNSSIFMRNRTGNYTENLTGYVTLSNTTVNHSGITFRNNDRIWWYIQFEDQFGRAISNTSVAIFDVLTTYAEGLKIHTDVNITKKLFVADNITTTGNLRVNGCLIFNISGVARTFGDCI